MSDASVVRHVHLLLAAGMPARAPLCCHPSCPPALPPGKQTSGNDVFYRNPFNVEENVFVNVSSPSSSK